MGGRKSEELKIEEKDEEGEEQEEQKRQEGKQREDQKGGRSISAVGLTERGAVLSLESSGIQSELF